VNRKRLYQFTAIDDCTRIRVLKVFDACNQTTAIRFMDDVFERLPFLVHMVQTDNGTGVPITLPLALGNARHPPRIHSAAHATLERQGRALTPPR
jgi:hypothetical protein